MTPHKTPNSPQSPKLVEGDRRGWGVGGVSGGGFWGAGIIIQKYPILFVCLTLTSKKREFGWNKHPHYVYYNQIVFE